MYKFEVLEDSKSLHTFGKRKSKIYSTSKDKSAKIEIIKIAIKVGQNNIPQILGPRYGGRRRRHTKRYTDMVTGGISRNSDALVAFAWARKAFQANGLPCCGLADLLRASNEDRAAESSDMEKTKTPCPRGSNTAILQVSKQNEAINA